MKKLIFELIEKNSPITGEALLKKLREELFSRGTILYNVSKRRMRTAINQMRHEGKKIGSSEQGYFIIKSLSQAVWAREYMRKPIKERAIIANLMVKNWNDGRQDCPAQLRFNLV